MLYSVSKALKRLSAAERAVRLAALQPRLQAVFRKNYGRRCNVRAGKVNPDTLECTLLEGVILECVELVERNHTLLFRVTTSGIVTHTDDIADIIFVENL